MRVLHIPGIGKKLNVADIPEPVAYAGTVKVDLKRAAFNRRDYWIQQGKYPGIAFPVVPGSDGAGVCDGEKVIIDAGVNWGADERCQARGFHLIGMPSQGTFAESIVVPKQNVYSMPAHLSWDQAAALPVAGVTAYRALFTRGNAKPGEKLLITGGGGGVALLALQFALATGMEIYVTTGSKEKLEKLKGFGATGGVVYKESNWHEQLKDIAGGFDMILDGTGGDNFKEFTRLCNPGGRIVIYGGTLGTINDLSPQHIFWRQISILGTTMGSPTDFQGMIDFVSRHEIVPIVNTVLDFEDANKGLDMLARSSQFGKIILRIS